VSVRRTTAIGLGLAGLILVAWAGLGCVALVLVPWKVWWPAAPAVIAVQCWLYVGLFIVAHDAIHGTLAPEWPALNRAVGRIFVLLYAGFDFDRLARSHHAHHHHSGTDHDPDFDAAHPNAFLPWFVTFFRRYFGLRQWAVLAAASLALAVALGDRAPLMLPFWALPAILSAVQLFYFGTYLPHRHEAAPFVDGHRARGSGFAWLPSLLTCFHFGHHHTHHAKPWVPWWRLPDAARGDKTCPPS
jgi:beta-carotene/zeaxanthin 4-ketolase